MTGTPPTAAAGSIRGFRLAVIVGWVLLSAAAGVYAHWKAVPAGIAAPLALAFLLEYPFYLLPGFAGARDRFMALGRVRAASLLAASAVAPWLIYALFTGHFSFGAFATLGGIALVTCFWYMVFPAHPVADLAYLCLVAALIIFKAFGGIYPRPIPRLDVSVLGHLMLIRVMALSITAIRGHAPADYRFLPNASEWLAGLRWFAILLPVTGAAYWALGLVSLQPHPMNAILIVGTFLGILWVTALSEEFIFRGLLQPWIEKWTSSPIVALVATSLLFGSIHLGFRGPFPNWRFSIAAAILGLFCGLARRQTGGIQAGMVAHALTVAMWKAFLQ